MKRMIIGCMALMFFAGCSEDAKEADSYTKSEAALMQGKSDSGRDICDLMNWYGDGECDTFCPQIDEDCATACTVDAECSVNEACISGTCATTAQGCGGIAGLQCAAGQYCSYEVSQRCGAADQLGECVTAPDSCDFLYDPVCGCDAQTYSNACAAAIAGVSVSSSGECTSACVVDSDCAVDQACISGVCQATTGDCLNDGQCAEGQVCISGVCEVASTDCTSDGECAEGQFCDAGVCTVSTSEACADDGACAEGEVCIDGFCENVVVGACTTDNDCRQDDVCIAGNCVTAGQFCGGIAGIQCAQDEFCHYAASEQCGAADQSGSCVAKPTTCSAEVDPVCGCDALVYANACKAAAAGVSVTRCNP